MSHSTTYTGPPQWNWPSLTDKSQRHLKAHFMNTVFFFTRQQLHIQITYIWCERQQEQQTHRTHCSPMKKEKRDEGNSEQRNNLIVKVTKRSQPAKRWHRIKRYFRKQYCGDEKNHCHYEDTRWEWMTECSLSNHDRVPTLQGLSQSHWDEMGTGDMAMQAWDLKHMHFNKYMKQQTGTHVTLRETLKTITVCRKVSGQSAV